MSAAVRTQFANGLVTAGENSYIAGTTASFVGSSRPPPLILCHSSGFDTKGVADDVLYQGALINELAQWFTVFVGDFGGEQWGNDTHVARIEAARVYLANTMLSTGLLTLVGISMGSCGALNYAKANPTLTRGVVATIPVLDLQDMRDNRGYGTLINAAYSNNLTVMNQHSPVMFASTMSSTLPVMIACSPPDAVCVASTATAFLAARPQTTYVNAGNDGHTFVTVASVIPQISRFARQLRLQ